MGNEVVVKTGKPTAADVKAMVEAQLKSAYEQAMAKQQAQIAEPEGPFQWDVLGFGPIQLGAGVFPFAGPPYLPNQIIRTGEDAFAVAILVFGPLFTSTLSLFGLDYEVTYSTGELKKWVLGPGNLQHVSTGTLIPGLPFAVDVFPFVANQDGLFEMNICARILGCNGSKVPPFAGFARSITKIEPIVFQPAPSTTFDTGMKFMVYA